MRFTTILGILLIIAGTAGLVWGGFELPRNREVAEIGPVEVEAQTTERVQTRVRWGPVVGFTVSKARTW